MPIAAGRSGRAGGMRGITLQNSACSYHVCSDICCGDEIRLDDLSVTKTQSVIDRAPIVFQQIEEVLCGHNSGDTGPAC